MENVELPEDFREFLQLLNERKVKYLLIGGYAVGYFGYPRTTADIDIWIDSTPENTDLVVEVFDSFGVQLHFLAQHRVIRCWQNRHG